jgi:hypothetical protein
VVKKIDYKALERRAIFSIVREILAQIAREGLYKDQHLYVTFSLAHPNVEVSDTLRRDFDDEITIVLQYEFWNLRVDDFGFSVSLAFQHSDETIYVPFAALITVSDPSEDFCIELRPDCSDVKKIQGGGYDGGRCSKVVSIDTFRDHSR